VAGQRKLGELNMAKYGRLKRAFFEDGMIIETARVSHLKRCVRERRVFEGYFGRVWFRPTITWQSLCEAERARYWEEAELADSHSCYANADAYGCCQVCGAVIYGSYGYRQLYGWE